MIKSKLTANQRQQMKRCICRKPIAYYVQALYIQPKQQGNEYQEASLPLKYVDFDINIVENVAETTLTQVYQNELDSVLETSFCFPMDNDVVMKKLECELNGKTIVGLIKEKEQAKKEYKEQKEQGNTVAYAEKDEKQPDIMKVDLGNIEPGQQIKVSFTYLQELEISQNKLYKYKILQSIMPRYQGEQTSSFYDNKYQQQNTQNTNQLTQISKENDMAYTTNIKFNIKSHSEINFVKSPSHDIQELQKSEFQYKGQVGHKGMSIFGEVNSKDFVLLYSNQAIQIPKAILAENTLKSQICSQISFVPDFNNVILDDAYRMEIEDSQKNFEVDIDAARGEYIFLLDRSGSMSGYRIQQAINALILFLKSLPSGSYFNIYSFGSGFEKFFNQSVNDEKSLQKAIQSIQLFSANMGGTQIYQPLQHILSQKQMKNYPRQIFLLTDGSVSDPQSVINLISQQSKNGIVNSIGIGSGASTYLVKECAKKGNGEAIFINDTDDVSGSIIGLLEQSMTPFLDNFQVKYDENIIESIYPNPKNIPCILKNKPFNMHIFFKPGVVDLENLNTKVEMSCYDSNLQKELNYEIPISKNQNLQNNDVFNIGCHKQIQILEDSVKLQNNQYKDDIMYAKEISLKDQIVILSTQNQILSLYTSFICVVQENTDGKKQEIINMEQKKIIVPQIIEQQQLYKQQQQQQQQQYLGGAVKYKKCKSKQISRTKISEMSYISNSMNMPVSNLNCQMSAPISMMQKSQTSMLNMNSAHSVQKPQYLVKTQEKKIQKKDKKEQKEVRSSRKRQSDSNQLSAISTKKLMMQEKQCKDNDDDDEEEEEDDRMDIEKEEEQIHKIDLLSVLKLQNSNGSWNYSENILSQLSNTDINNLLVQLSGKLCLHKDDNLNKIIYMTYMICLWLQEKQQGQKNSWNLIYKKATKFIEKQGINTKEIGQSYTQLLK